MKISFLYRITLVAVGITVVPTLLYKIGAPAMAILVGALVALIPTLVALMILTRRIIPPPLVLGDRARLNLRGPALGEEGTDHESG